MKNTTNNSEGNSLERRLEVGLGNLPVQVRVSEKAMQRTERDRRISQNMAKFWDYVARIASSPIQYPQEIIGEFRISPRGHNPLRIAWGYDSATKTLNIYDFLYHISDKDYVDRWNRKAANGTITREDYQQAGFIRAA
jgi:hypothetical protein